MGSSKQPHRGAVRAQLEFPVWHRSFTKSYAAWANAPSDLKTPLLLQGQALSKAETWLLSTPEKLTESQKRFIVRSIALRSKGQVEPVPMVGRSKVGKRSKWRRSSDRSLWHLYAVIGLGLWFFSPGIVKELMERALNPPEVYEQLRNKEAQKGTPGQVAGTEQTPEQAAAQAAMAEEVLAPLGSIDETPPLYKPAKPPQSRSARLADIARERLEAGQHKVALLVGLEATTDALADDDSGTSKEDAAAAAGVVVRAMATREQLGKLATRSATAETTLFCHEARALMTIDLENKVSIWPAGTSRKGRPVELSHPTLEGATADRDCRRLALQTEDYNLQVTEIGSGRTTAVLNGHESNIMASRFSPDGTLIATASRDGTARIWDARNGRQRFLLSGHDWHVVDVDFSPDGRRVVTASSDMTARIWDPASGRQIQLLRGHQGVVTSARFSADGKRVITTSWDGFARLWDATDGSQLLQLVQPGGLVSAALSRNSERIATATAEGAIQLWDASNGQQLHALNGPGGAIRTMSFTPDGRWLVVLTWEGQIETYDPQYGRLISNLTRSSQPKRAISLGVGGRSLVAIGEDGLRSSWPLLSTPEDAIAAGIAVAPACLGADARATLGLDGPSPAWCDSARPRDAALP